MHNDAEAASRALREPQDNVPPTKQQRSQILQAVCRYIEREKPVSPLSIDELQMHCERILKAANSSQKYKDYTAVLLNSELWRDTVAAIDYDKRLLLLPKCLRDQDKCQGTFDEIGLVCEHCGSCIIDKFKSHAEQLGYAVLIAEGSPVVMSLIETGQIEAVVGVSCLCVLERVFPYMEAGAVPGIAIPLLRDGCANTSVDIDWVWDAIYTSKEDRGSRLNLDQLRNMVDGWFSKESLQELFALGDSQTEQLALEWMAKAGKRWRPFLAVCAYKALAEEQSQLSEQELHKAAMAVECFHKASLIHDDIEDDDVERYGEKTLHVEYGIGIALNVGDFLLGEGYRLLSELEIAPELKAGVIQAAVHGHRDLCLGQGNELAWAHQPKPMSVSEVIEIFRKKTAPAFEVALKIGSILSGRIDELSEPLEQYSQALGIAYQIRDDIEDFYSKDSFSVPAVTRPSFLLALGYEFAKGRDKAFIESIWNRSVEMPAVAKDLQGIFAKLQIERSAFNSLESYKSQAIAALALLKNANLKGLLRRVAGKIFNDFEMMGCCNDHTQGHAQSSGQSDASA